MTVRRIGPYTVVRELGSGGMGSVYLATSPAGQAVAVKLVRPELADDPGFRRRFAAEVAAARAVSGAFTAAVVDADPDGPQPWLATVYAPGTDLAAFTRSGGPLPEPRLRELGARLAEALTAIHRAGIVHRDLKPGNVLMTADGPLVIDFGISRSLEGTRLTRTGALLGTPAYMSPEQVGSGHDIGPPSDVFSLGGVLVFAATGRGPFGSGPLETLLYKVVYEQPDLDGVPRGLRPLLLECLDKDPARRPSPPELFAVLTGGPKPAPPPKPHSAAAAPTLPTQARPGRRRLLVALGGSIAGIVLAGGGAVLATRQDRPGAGPATPPSSPASENPAPVTVWTHAPSNPPELGSLELLGDTLVWYNGSTVLAYDPETGTLRWTGADKAPRGLPEAPEWDGVFGETLIGRTVTRSGGMRLLGLSPAGRVVLDRVVRDRAFDPETKVYQVRAADRGLVLIQGGLGRNDIGLIAVGLADGRRLWTLPQNERPGVTTADGRLFVNDGSTMSGHDLRSGRRLWKKSGYGSFTLAESLLITHDSRGIRALDPATGQTHWTARWPTSESSDVIGTTTDRVFAVSADREVRALDLRTGEVVWRHRADESLGTGCAASDRIVLAATRTEAGRVRFTALDGATGELRWAHGTPPLEGSRRTPNVLVSDDTVYAASTTALHAFKAPSA